LNHVIFDHQRSERIGLPEAVFSEGKPLSVLLALLERFAKKDADPILFTRLSEERFAAAPEPVRSAYRYDPIARVAFAKIRKTDLKGKVAVVAAGSADAPVTWEAARTLEYLNIEYKVFEDCGVAGLWRLQEKIEEIRTYDAVIAVAGLEAALTSILGGLLPQPIIGVPTSVGYGVCEEGKTALHSMLASCAPGVTVLNIGNGYGAACAASRILYTMNRRNAHS
jgi:hypothetical protein